MFACKAHTKKILFTHKSF